VRRWFAARRLVCRGSDLAAMPGPSWQRIRTAIHQAIYGR